MSAKSFLFDVLLNERKNDNTGEIFTTTYEVQSLDFQSLGLIDRESLAEIKFLCDSHSALLLFGKTLRDIKCVIQDENGERQHELFLNYKEPKKIIVSSVNLPHSPLQETEYKALEDVITAYKSYINDLSSYFYELERIDQFCSVVEPVNPSFRDNYRRILLDDRTWLHLEVTSEGLATNVHLIGNSELMHNKLHAGLLTWDHDKDIVQNIMSVFDITEFPVPTRIIAESNTLHSNEKQLPTCGICLCDELPDNVGMPQPLCQNSMCGVYFHRSCLYQWLVACSGNRAPAFGVATGSCPTCLQPISCGEKGT